MYFMQYKITEGLDVFVFITITIIFYMTRFSI